MKILPKGARSLFKKTTNNHFHNKFKTDTNGLRNISITSPDKLSLSAYASWFQENKIPSFYTKIFVFATLCKFSASSVE